MVEAVFAGFEGAAFSQAKEIEAVAAADNAVLFHLGGDGRGSGARGDIDEGFGRRTVRSIDDVGGGCGCEKEKQQEGSEKLQICASVHS